MVWSFPERLNVAKIILLELSKKPLQYSVLRDKAKVKGVTPSIFASAFAFLVADGDVEKCGSAHRAPFRVTERGKAFLAWRECK